MNTTTRRYSRSMREAFPADYAGWIEGHRPSITERIADVLMATIIGCSLAALIVHWATS